LYQGIEEIKLSLFGWSCSSTAATWPSVTTALCLRSSSQPLYSPLPRTPRRPRRINKSLRTFLFPETFEVDISNTKKLLEGERGQMIAQKGIIVSVFFDMILVKSK
jgi:hypothetical protein